LVPIEINQFSFNGSGIYIGSGKFDTASTAFGEVELNNLYIPQCDVFWTIPPTAWTGSNDLVLDLWKGLFPEIYIPSFPIDFVVELLEE
jgi:hypothetical protein